MAAPLVDRLKQSIKELGLTNIGKWNTKRGSDPLPYSLDSYQIDEPGIKKLEGEFGKTRYQLGDLGGGGPNSLGFGPNNKWSDSYEKK
jgi:hypothetical protein